jgi:hypothetical protein
LACSPDWPDPAARLLSWALSLGAFPGHCRWLLLSLGA